MAVMKKGLAVILIVLAAVSTIAISAFADDLSSYTIETYFMTTNGAYDSVPDSTEREYANVGSEVQIQSDELEGFTVDGAKSDSSVIVADDGSAVAKIYYQRNKYTLTYHYEDLVGPQLEEAEVYYGAEIPAFEANPSGKPAKTGYDFIMWSTVENDRTEAPETMPANDVDLYPVYELKTFTYTFDAGEGGSFPDGEQIHTDEYSYGDTPVRPDDPAREHYEFADWDVDLPSFVDGDLTFEAMYNEKCYTVYFFDGEELVDACDGYYFGDWFEEIDAPEGYDSWTLDDGTDVEFPYEINGDTYFYVSDVQDEYSDYLGLRTELYTYDETLGDWVVADKVERGEKVKARLFIETGFGVANAQLLLFYNEDAFTCEYSGIMENLNLANDSSDSTTGQYPVNETLSTPSKNNLNYLIKYGYLQKDFMDNHSPIIFTFSFLDHICHKINGDEWFAEFELTAKSDAVGKGDFFIVPETICNPDDGLYAYIDFEKGEDGTNSLESDSTESMIFWYASTYVESNPVSTGYGRLVADAGEGAFDDGSSVMKFDYPAGSAVDVYPEPTLEGYVFDGYEPEIPDIIEDEVIRVKAKWAPAEDTAYSVTVHYVDFEDGEAIYNEDTFEFAGVTGSTVEIVDEMPESPEYNTEYILVDDLAMNDYNVVDVAADNIISTVIAADGSSVLEIFFKLASYEVEFYADEGTFPDGSNIVTAEAVYGTPASSIVPEDEPRRRGYIFAGWNGVDEAEIITDNTVYYALWEKEKYEYTVFYLASGDVPENFELPASEIKTEGDFIIIPEEYSADGYIFEGWYYNGERYESGSQIIMPAENITLICKWKRIAVETTTKPVVTETTTVKPTTTTTKPVVTETTTVKPTTTTTTKPVVTETTTVKPTTTTTKPVVTETTTVKPTTTTKPVVTETTTVKPTTTTTKPVVTETTTVKPTTTTKPVVTETTTVKPTTTTTKPVVTETTTVKPTTTTTKPVVTETTTVKPTTTTTKPVVTETTTVPATTKPVVTEPETTKPAEPTTKPQTAVFEIRQPSLTTIKYGDSIILHADVVEGERPQDVRIEWEADNGNFTILSVSEDGSTCTVTPNKKGDTVFTITVFDKDGNEIGSDTQKMTSKAGFFQKIIAFFKKIFGLTKVYPQAFKDVI